ncbi:DUF2911 domain-containing protein [Flavobacteriaceae bacterium TP-CH-4]|uniref:DUF2911 domain-containing protein n=1 Tax=Pelagihabitans pacificus TaxID=2696054 RepID=A0A967APQ7_9FLAO|nr:DUF2911 domain-containing protein [Pelagihabitans pacificus]NHF58064.1 DUF2911 domain-containing protein [Pelagihabitans pacificus]
MKSAVCIVLFLFSPLLSAQINHPKASPFSTVVQEVGLATLKVEYSRPAVRGRTIFGDVVPFNRIWRVGANASTKLTVDSDVVVLENILPAGTYALYAFPDEEEWQIVFHKNTTHWGDGRKAYNPEEDAFRVKVVPEQVPTFQENFLITFDVLQHGSVHMIWLWEHTKVTIPMTVDTHKLMLKEIDASLSDSPTAQTYYEAARYLQEQQTDYTAALDYLNKALELGGDTYYFHRVKSLVEAGLEDYPSAIASAQKSLELAEREGKDEFVRMNQKNIEIWSGFLNRDKK